MPKYFEINAQTYKLWPEKVGRTHAQRTHIHRTHVVTTASGLDKKRCGDGTLLLYKRQRNMVKYEK